MKKPTVKQYNEVLQVVGEIHRTLDEAPASPTASDSAEVTNEQFYALRAVCAMLEILTGV